MLKEEQSAVAHGNGRGGYGDREREFQEENDLQKAWKTSLAWFIQDACD